MTSPNFREWNQEQKHKCETFDCNKEATTLAQFNDPPVPPAVILVEGETHGEGEIRQKTTYYCSVDCLIQQLRCLYR